MEALITWTTFFEEKVERNLCSNCEARLEEIKGPVCQSCCRPLEKLAPQYIMGENCHDCVRWDNDPEWKGFLQRNESIYVYNEFLKEMISRFKFRGDYIVAKVFSRKMKAVLRNTEYDFLVPIPLSDERQLERGFNQSEAIICEAGLSSTPLLHRTHSEKQSKKSRTERIHIEQVFRFNGEVEITNKKIILIDDIYTTGSTLRHAAKILIQEGAATVSSLTIARG